MGKKKKRKNSRQFNKRFRKKFFSSNTKIVLLIALIICAGIGIACLKAHQTAKEYKKQISELSTEIKDLKSENKSLEEEIENRNSDEYIEKMAREHLGMIKKGEYSLQESKEAEESDSSKSTTEKKK